MRYEHKQKAPMYLLLVVFAGAMVIAAVVIPESVVKISLFSAAGVMTTLAVCFHHLTVRDEDDCLLVSFGPLPLFRRRIEYADIDSLSPVRSTWLDGWGIHMSASGGWVWNIWGFDAVDIRFKQGGKLRLGTDDQDELLRFLQDRVESAA